MQKLISFFKLIANASLISFFMLFIIFANKKYIPYELFLQETLPFFQTNFAAEIFSQNIIRNDSQTKKVFNNNEDIQKESLPNTTANSEKKIDFEKESSASDIIDENNIEYEYSKTAFNPNIEDLDKLQDITYLKSKFYVCDSKTDITSEDFNVNKFLATDTTIDNSLNEPKILIFHTHSTEMFKDSNENDMYEGVVGLGKKLAQILNDKYNIKTLHHTKRYDIINGKPDKRGAYERMEPEVSKIIKDNPSLEVAIDIHRDGVADSVHLVENINGKQTAKIMFVNGLCKILKDNVLTNINNLPNPYLDTNLALSFKMQMQSYKLYPNLTRKIYINAYRYSLNMLAKSLLIEVGAQTNTKQEALNAMEPLADILASVILK